MSESKEVGKKLRNARKRAGLTQEQTADLLNIKQQAYARYESGVIELDYHKIILLCKIFDTTPDYLFGFEDEDGIKIIPEDS